MDNRLLLDAICKSCLDKVSAQPYEDALAILPELLNDDPTVEMAYARWIREKARDAVVECGTDVETAKRILEAREDILGLNAWYDFDSYMLFTEWNREPAKQFWLPRRHVLYPIAEGFQDLADDRLDILIICLPPRVGKSTTGVFAETWQMGRHPMSANVMSGHSDKLTKGFHLEALSIISDGDTYRFREVFPESPLVGQSMADETITLRRKNRRFPTLTCRSVDGTLTGAVEIGREGWLYCDDMVSDREEALSAPRMDKLYSAYLNQLKDRKLDGAKEVHIGTRWVPNDVTGRIIDRHESDPRCRVICIPALNDKGETNFDYLYDLGFSTEYYEDMKASLEENGESDSWSAKYMCKPYWIGGLMFPSDELKYFDELPEGEPDAIVGVCDTKDRGADYAVLLIGYIYDRKHYIYGCICDNSLPEVVEPRIAAAICKYKAGLVRFESNAAGGRVADGISERCRAAGWAFTLQKKFSTENKETRILVDSAWIKENCYFHRVPPNADYARFMQMLNGYTTEGRNKHDDAPDAMSMYKRLVCSVVSAQVEAFDRPF